MTNWRKWVLLPALVIAFMLASPANAQFATPPTQGTICGRKGTMPNGVQYEVICQDLALLRGLGVPVIGEGWVTQIFMTLPERADAVRVTVDKTRATWAEQYTHVAGDLTGKWMAAAAIDGLHYELDEIAVFARIR